MFCHDGPSAGALSQPPANTVSTVDSSSSVYFRYHAGYPGTMSKANQDRLYRVATKRDKTALQAAQQATDSLEASGGGELAGRSEYSRAIEHIEARLYTLRVDISKSNGDREPPTLEAERRFFVQTQLLEEEQQRFDKLNEPALTLYLSTRARLRDQNTGERDRLLCAASNRIRSTATCSEAQWKEFEANRMRNSTKGWAPT